MKGSLWQHPFVDVFKYAGISEWRQCHKEGDVTETIDKIISKKVYKLQGSVSASNYIQIPKAKSDLKSLGLNGKYIYIQLRVSPGKLFSLHLDLILTNTRTNLEEPLKLSLSNLFKESKMQNSLQIACRAGGKWTVLCVDLRALLAEFFAERMVFKELKMVTLCANMHVKGVYTSDILYNPKTLPKEMGLKVMKIEEWSSSYDWMHVPEAFGNENYEKEVESKEVAKEERKKPAKVYVKNEYRDKTLGKKGKNSEKKIEPKPTAPIPEPKPEILPEKLPEKSLPKVPKPQKKPQPQPLEPIPQCIEIPNKNLNPDPILELSNTLSISPSINSLLFAPAEIFASYPSPFKDHTNKFLFYISQRLIVVINPKSHLKQFFVGHTSNVKFLQLFKTYLVSADETANIYFWPLKSRKNPIPLPVKKLKEIVFFAFFATKMIVTGKDDLNRDLILMYETSKIFKKREIVHLGQQLSDFDIKVIKFIEETRLISCGKDAIRMWVYKDEHLIGTTIPIPTASPQSFTDLEVSGKKAYISSSKGSIFIINLLLKELEVALSIHTSSISRVKICEDIVITSSEDTYVRLWPLDFHEVYMEIQHKSKVSDIDILGNNAVSLTETGVLGLIDLEQTVYGTILRNFQNTQFFHVSNGHFAVITSLVSVLDQNLQPLCEFASPKDETLCCAVHPVKALICCGFYSGAIRFFDLNSVKVTEEFVHHKAPIEKISFSMNGNWMISISEDGAYSIYDGEKKFQPVKDGRIDMPCVLSACFSKNSEYLAIVNSYSGAVSIIALSCLSQKFKINVTGIITHIEFSHDFLMVSLSDPVKMIYYQITEDKVLMGKEVPLQYTFNSFKVSENSQFIAAVTNDFNIRIYDFYFTACQVFLGHTSPISLIVWNADKIYSLSELDGIYIWAFNGSLVIKPSEVVQYENSEILEISQESEDALEIDIEKEVEDYLRNVELIQTNMLIPMKPSLKYMFGYSAVANSLHWSPEKSSLLYTLGGIIVKTLLVGEKKQVLLQGHYNQIGALAVSPNGSLIASAEGLATFEGSAKINIWDFDTGKICKVLEYHDQSVTCMHFSPCNEYLCSIGNLSDPVLVIWELLTSRPIATSILSTPAISVKWLPQISVLEFATLSPTDLIFWRVNSLKRLEFQPGEAGKEEMTCMDYSPYFEDVSSNLLVIGTKQGSLYVCNTRTNSFIFAKKMFSWGVFCITCKSKFVVIGGNNAEVFMWKWADGVFNGNGVKVLCDGFPVALSFNNTGSEGIIGTQSGSLWYVEWDSGTVRVISSHSKPIISLCADELIATGAEDNTIRIWNPKTLEQNTHILVPTSKCRCLVFHKSLPYLVAGFHDGSIKAFEVQSSKCLGSSRSSLSAVTCIVFSLDSDGIVLGTENGIVIAVVVKKWMPFTVDFVEFASMSSEILDVDVRSRLVLASTSDGVLNVWEKKYSGETLSHTKLFENTDLQFNLIDIFDFKEPHERTKHFYSQADSLECHSKFDPTSEKMVWVIVKGAQYLIYRNYFTHLIVRKINLAGFPLCLGVHEHKVAVGLADRRVIVYFDGTIHEYLSHSDPVYNLAFLPNGFVTSASIEIGLWAL